MPKFRKKPIVVEAMHFTLEDKDRVFHWITCTRIPTFDDIGQPMIAIRTLEGDMKASIGNWIIRDENGEYSICKPDIFAKTYEPVEEA